MLIGSDDIAGSWANNHSVLQHNIILKFLLLPAKKHMGAVFIEESATKIAEKFF